MDTDEKTLDVSNSTHGAEQYTGGLYVILWPSFTWINMFFLCPPYIIQHANSTGLEENGYHLMHRLRHQNSINLYHSCIKKIHAEGPSIQKGIKCCELILCCLDAVLLTERLRRTVHTVHGKLIQLGSLDLCIPSTN